MIRIFHFKQRTFAMAAMAGFAASALAENAAEPGSPLSADVLRAPAFAFDMFAMSANNRQRFETTLPMRADGSSTALTVGYRHLDARQWRLEREGIATMQPTAFSFVSRSRNGQDYAVGMGSMASHYFGAAGLGVAAPGTINTLPALGNPYFALLPSASHAGFSREVGGIRMKFGVLTTGLSHAMAEHAFDPDAFSPALMTVQPRINSRVLELSKSFDHAAISLSLMRSKETPIPGAARSVTSFGLGAPTSSAQLTGVWLLAPKIAFAAQASYGRTPGGPSYGIFGGASPTRSNAFALGVVASDRYYRGDRLSFSVSQPIRVYAVASENDAVISQNAVTVPTGREVLAELNYVRPMGKSAYGGWAVAIRRQPDNITDAPTEKQFRLRYGVHF